MEHADEALRRAASDPQAFEGDLGDALEEVGQVDPAGLEPRQQFAHLLTAHNVAGLQAVRWARQAGGLTRVRFLRGPCIRVGGRARSVQWLRRLLRPHLETEPRGVLALWEPFPGAPPLHPGAFQAEGLDGQLESAARAFMSPGTGYVADHRQCTLWVSGFLHRNERFLDPLGGIYGVFLRYAQDLDVAWEKSLRPVMRRMRAPFAVATDGTTLGTR